jgi:hypothetical protein
VKSLPYISTQAYQSTLQSINVVSTLSLFSTFSLQNQLGFYTDRSTFTQNFQSTVKQVNENASYVSSLTLTLSLQSTVAGIPFVLGNYTQRANLFSTTEGIRNYAGTNGYVSTLSTFAISDYVSSKTLDYSLYSTTNAIFSRTSVISTASLTSTIDSLGQLYLSSIKISSFGLITMSTLTYSGNKSETGTSYFTPTYAFNSNADDTIFIPGVGNIVPAMNPFYAEYFTYDLFLYTAQFQINSFANFITNRSRVQIDFNLNFFIKSLYYGSSFPTRFLPMTSYLTYDSGTIFSAEITTIQEGITTEHVCYFQGLTSDISIKVTKRISFTILGSNIIPALDKLITLRHRIEYFTSSPDGEDGKDGEYLVFPSPQNSIFVSIYN